ncbi:DUF7309 domain-containing protein [Bacilliculturomica massiliensis]|uniref:DUF7309 domain-containing protein n=1 Tax=Bacilliculturomica massiliensis TaxID=1917867 RepID=UPI00102FB903|nr:hypothetical protein [Bacilliculturomica massiliensis]
MRKEASPEQWGELYASALELLSLEPWGYFWDMDLVAVRPDPDGEPAFCSIMGRIGSCYGIGVYPGEDGLCDLQMIADLSSGPLSAEYMMHEQSSLCCYLGDREEVPPPQYKIIRSLGLKFRGRGKWVYFQSFKRRYSPCTPDEAEVLLLTGVFRGLIAAVKAVAAGQIAAGFSEGRILWQEFDRKTGWNLHEGELPDVQKRYPVASIRDDLLKQRLKKQPCNGSELLLDFCYMNVSIEDPSFDRPANPLLFLAIDSRSGMVVDTRLLTPDSDETDEALDFFISYVMEFGRMKSIRARNPWIFGALDEICSHCSIPLLMDPLTAVDKFLKDFQRQMIGR